MCYYKSMEINTVITDVTREGFQVEYRESDPGRGSSDRSLHSAHGFCFYDGQMVLVRHPTRGWMPPGGGIEAGEDHKQAIVREVKEETNMKVVHQELIGYVDVWRSDKVLRMVRSFCAVIPEGPFCPNPQEEITEIKLIDPGDYRSYFDWGEIGARMMKRALELQAKYQNSRK